MKFSVLMVTYKLENPDYLYQSLGCVFNQTLVPNEVVLILDGKVPNTLLEVIDYYKNKYPKIFRVIKFKKHSDLGTCLKKGVNYCKYDIIARMDSDDYCVNNRFEKQIEILKNNKEIDMVGSLTYESTNNINEIIHKKVLPQHDDEIKKMIKVRNPFCHPSVMFRKQAVLSAGNYEKKLYFEDYYLWCKMTLNNCKFYNIQEYLITMRSDKEFINRRGGYKYCKHTYDFEKSIYKLGIITKSEFLKNCCYRFFVALIPSKFRRMIYKYILRRE